MWPVDIRLDTGYVEIICDGGCISINKVRLVYDSEYVMCDIHYIECCGCARSFGCKHALSF